MLFSFHNGELYKISVTYDQPPRKGSRGGHGEIHCGEIRPATNVVLEIDSAKNDRYDATQKPVASWEDAQYSFNLVRSSFTDRLGLIIYSKRVNAEAELAIAEAVKLEEQRVLNGKPNARKNKRMTWKWPGRRIGRFFAVVLAESHKKSIVRVLE